MIWDPAGLKVTSISPEATASDELKVTITLTGEGFDTPFHVLFVASETKDVIPGNNPTLVTGNTVASVDICPNGKHHGHYDLVMWLPPPRTVRDDTNKDVPGIPVNAVFIKKKALHVAQKPKRTTA